MTTFLDGDPVDPDRVAGVEALTKAVVWALMTANQQPYPIPVPAARNIAEMMYDCGVRQTDQVATEIELPGWVTERVREETAPVPTEPDHQALQDTELVTVAPAEPRRIPEKFMGVVGEGEL